MNVSNGVRNFWYQFQSDRNQKLIGHVLKTTEKHFQYFQYSFERHLKSKITHRKKYRLGSQSSDYSVEMWHVCVVNGAIRNISALYNVVYTVHIVYLYSNRFHC